ncbi:MAG TPA: peptide ABC transporter substrate-binding protein [Pyrinomonadaceae bacterium]|nr:peptide ABC transporter substrate-binding protein [Pyrinomonadaceae bacterium]
MPKSIDPVTAAAPPETDLVRAVYDGLTDLDPKTLEAVPGVAERWEPTDDQKTWTFKLRKDAKWTNGSAVTAQDFVFAWRRLAAMGEKTAHSGLLNNITGYYPKPREESPEGEMPQDFLLGSLDRETSPGSSLADANQGIPLPSPATSTEDELPEEVSPDVVEVPAPSGLGVTAIASDTLKVSLKFPDKDFPKLVANPIFRPVYDDGKANPAKLDQNSITNGAFRIASADKNEIRLVRSESYWGRQGVKLESIRFIRFETPERALDAYRAGEIDAVSNADFSPAALKLLEPYDDFRRATHSALNLYQINIKRPPFDDRRVREALAISIERERLTEGQLEGSTRPAFRFTPFVSESGAALFQDVQRAKNLMSDAGYPEGRGFPVMRLLVNRNDAQLRIARAVARMWKQNLNLETEIIVKHSEEFDVARESGEFDLVRRGVVLPTSDEMANVLTIFGLPEEKAIVKAAQPTPNPSPSVEPGNDTMPSQETVVTENAALLDFRAIPLYFPTSYSLVKPYVVGFDVNSLDAPSLRAVSVDGNWQPGTTRAESN